MQIAGHSQGERLHDFRLGQKSMLWASSGRTRDLHYRCTLARGFRFGPALDEHRNVIPVDVIPVDVFNYTNGLNMRPQLFKVRITPRNESDNKTRRKASSGRLGNVWRGDAVTDE